MKAQSTCDLLRARWCEPVLSVVDIRVGDDEEAATDPFYRFGPTRFSVIPRSAVGNVSVRFVPDQVCHPFRPCCSEECAALERYVHFETLATQRPLVDAPLRRQ